MHSLPIFLRLTRRPVILVGTGEAADAKRRVLERAGAAVVNEDAVAALAIVALDDDRQAEAAVARLKARGILVNAVDRPLLCDFTLPAIVDRDPVLIAIGTGGTSAGLAAAVRQRLETLLPPALGTLANTLFASRAALKRRWPEARARRQAIGAALSPGGALDLMRASAPDAVATWIAADDKPATGNTITTIRLQSPDPDELTLLAARLLAQADCVCYTADTPLAILNRARADAAKILCAEAPEHCTHGSCVFLTS